MNLPLNRSLLALAVLVCLCVAGCDSTSSVTKANYDKITTGMTEQEVADILGKPNQQSGAEVALPSAGLAGLDMPSGKVGSNTKTWTEGTNTITIVFMNEKVFTKAWTGK